LQWGVSPNFAILALSVLIGALGLSLFSGTFEVLVYDSLKQIRKESEYDKNCEYKFYPTYCTPACGAVGGFMYAMNPSLPYFVTGAFYLTGCIAAFFLTEPRIDTYTFSFSRYVNANETRFS
jgi:hypothetical protein